MPERSTRRHSWITGACGVAMGLLVAAVSAQDARQPAKPDAGDAIRAAVAAGKVAWKLTGPEELEELLGPPTEKTTEKDGGMEVLQVRYPGVSAIFGRMRETSAPFALLRLSCDDEKIDIGEDRPIVLRDTRDLAKFDDFWGFANASLAKLDLRGQGELLNTRPFDSRTQWPPAERLPEDFDPRRRLEDGKDPGLCIRALHKQGIDGRGVRLAIIDQPMLVNHQEFVDRIERYEAIDVAGVEPQMHGPPVASIAVGKTCGVAPGARLTYFATPSWKGDNGPFCEALDKLIEDNEKRTLTDRIRIVSISTGMFAQWKNYERWQQTLARAAEQGILVLTCDQTDFRYGMLSRIPGGNPDDPGGFRAGRYGVTPGAVLVPAGNRTTASHYGPDVYTYWVSGGMSWATPYVAGLAGLALQVNPELDATRIPELLRQTATKTDAGLVVNPTAFVEAARKGGS